MADDHDLSTPNQKIEERIVALRQTIDIDEPTVVLALQKIEILAVIMTKEDA